MRARNICEYVMETPGNTNITILKQLLEEYAAAVQNELSSYTIDVDINANTDLLGKKIDDLQKDVFIDDGKFYGKLYYVTNYTGFSGDPSEQNGYYICFHVECDGADYIKVNGVTLDEDGIHIILLRNINKENKATIEIKKSSNIYTDEISFGGLEFIGKKPASEQIQETQVVQDSGGK